MSGYELGHTGIRTCEDKLYGLLSHEALLDFLEFGMAGAEIHPNVENRPDLFPTFPIDRLCGERVEPRVTDPEEAEHLIFGALIDVISSYQSLDFESFALSGGADTRLIFSLLSEFNPTLFRSLRFYVRRHPRLCSESDRDTAIARRLCERASVPLEIETPLNGTGFYLVSARGGKKRVLCGLFGGELLGGQLLNILPYGDEEVLMCTRESKLKNKLIQLKDVFAGSEAAKLQIAFRLLADNPLSAIYRNKTWIAPFRIAESAAVTPFLDPRFLKALFSVDLSLIADYSLYRRILKNRAARFLDLPVNNKMIACPPEIAFPDWGVEPKTVIVPPGPHGQANDCQKQFLQRINSLPEKRYSDYLRSVAHVIC